MTLPERSLRPASGDDRWSFLGALEFVAGTHLQFGKVVGTVVRQCMAFDPCPQLFDRVEVGRVRRQKGDLDVPVQRVEIGAYQAAAMCPQTIPDDQQTLLEMRLEHFEEGDNLFLSDAAFVQPEQAVAACESGNHRDVIPVEVKLDDGRFPFGRPGTHTSRTFADARFVDEDNQPAFSPRFFF